ncbi:MAG: single-stranded DNA-binding protein [Oligoflexales bacterium]
MASVNRVIILGNLGQDPEVRYTPSGAAVCTLSVATTDSRVDKSGQKQESTEWHRVVVWNKQAENCAKYLKKGRSVYVEGRLQTRSWDDKTSGQKRYSTEIIAQTVQFIGGGSRSESQDSSYAEPAFSPNFKDSLNDDILGGSRDDLGGASLDDIPF